MILWAAANSFALASRAWDLSPYILLNLFSSMLAGLLECDSPDCRQPSGWHCPRPWPPTDYETDMAAKSK